MQKRKYITIGAGIFFSIFFLLMAISTYYQSTYLSLKIFDKEIQRVELVTYESEPFNSEIKDIIFLEDPIFHASLSEKMNMQDVALNHPQMASTVLFIYYKNNIIINAYVHGDKLGLNYGQVWLNVKGFSDEVNSYK